MSTTPNDPAGDAWVEQLVHFDEELRLGHDPSTHSTHDTELQSTQNFLVHLQALWGRAPKKIGPYTLVRSLGQGAIGPAFLVEAPATHKTCVLKILWPDLTGDPSLRQQFLREAINVQTLRHPQVAAVRDARLAGAICLVVQDFLSGVSLAQWRLQHSRPIPWPLALSFIARIADVIEVAHRQGIGHGNLKPSNLFFASGVEITEENLLEAPPCINDLGLARPILESRLPAKMGLPWPAPHYLAPEQLQRQTDAHPAACDLYALGVIWYELLTCRSPLKGVTRDEVLAQVRTAQIVGPRQHVPEIPEAIESLLLQLLSKKPQDRPASAYEFAERCRTLLPTPADVSAQPAWWKQWLRWK